MTILGIETATPILSVALRIESEHPFEGERRAVSQSSHCELVNGFIEELMEQAEISPDKLDGIAVSIGPGSFTGLRIGIASAMGLAYGLNIPACGVSTLMGIASAVSAPDTLVCPLIDAKRGEAYTALYRLRSPSELPEVIIPPAAMPVERLAANLAKFDEPITLTGPGADHFGAAIRDSLPSTVTITPAECAQPSALAITALGHILFHTGHGVPPAALEPVYLRRSDAEIARDSSCARP